MCKTIRRVHADPMSRLGEHHLKHTYLAKTNLATDALKMCKTIRRVHADPMSRLGEHHLPSETT